MAGEGGYRQFFESRLQELLMRGRPVERKEVVDKERDLKLGLKAVLDDYAACSVTSGGRVLERGRVLEQGPRGLSPGRLSWEISRSGWRPVIVTLYVDWDERSESCVSGLRISGLERGQVCDATPEALAAALGRCLPLREPKPRSRVNLKRGH